MKAEIYISIKIQYNYKKYHKRQTSKQTLILDDKKVPSQWREEINARFMLCKQQLTSILLKQAYSSDSIQVYIILKPCFKFQPNGT